MKSHAFIHRCIHTQRYHSHENITLMYTILFDTFFLRDKKTRLISLNIREYEPRKIRMLRMIISMAFYRAGRFCLYSIISFII